MRSACKLQLGMGVNQTVRAIEVKYDSELHFGSLKDKNNIFFKIKALTGNTQSEHQLKIFMTSYTNMVNQSKRNSFPQKMKP